VTLPVQRPNKAKFFRIHPTLHADISIYKIKEGSKGGEIFAVYPKMVSRIEGCSLFTLFLGSHKDGSLFLWPVNAVSSDNWSKSSRQIAIAAMKVWCRLVTDQNAGLFVKREAKSITDEPVFPTDKTFIELLTLAFDPDHIVANESHRLVQELWQ
jgi:hypothetical protein